MSQMALTRAHRICTLLKNEVDYVNADADEVKLSLIHLGFDRQSRFRFFCQVRSIRSQDNIS